MLFFQSYLNWHLCTNTKCTIGRCSLLNVHRGHVFGITAALKIIRDCPSGPPFLLLPPLSRHPFFLLKGSYCPDFLAYFSILYRLKYTVHVLWIYLLSRKNTLMRFIHILCSCDESDFITVYNLFLLLWMIWVVSDLGLLGIVLLWILFSCLLVYPVSVLLGMCVFKVIGWIYHRREFPTLHVHVNVWHCLLHFSHSSRFIASGVLLWVFILLITNEIEHPFILVYLLSFEYCQLWSACSLILLSIFLLGCLFPIDF